MAKANRALTPDEWAALRVVRDGLVAYVAGGVLTIGQRDLPGNQPDDRPEEPAYDTASEHGPEHMTAVITLANVVLPDGDPRKITRKWVEAMRVCATEAERGALNDDARAVVALVRGAADALESYLPPEDV